MIRRIVSAFLVFALTANLALGIEVRKAGSASDTTSKASALVNTKAASVSIASAIKITGVMAAQ
jgi:hypothetical protein